jgi:hypothetical protein
MVDALVVDKAVEEEWAFYLDAVDTVVVDKAVEEE